MVTQTLDTISGFSIALTVPETIYGICIHNSQQAVADFECSVDMENSTVSMTGSVVNNINAYQSRTADSIPNDYASTKSPPYIPQY